MKMTETLSVSLSGPAFSFLLYENVRSDFDQEGFILGECIQKETKTITDHDQTQVNLSKVIKVNSVVPCPHTGYFYDNVGRIDKSLIKRLLGNQFSKVVAWYKFKRTNSFRFTFREKIIHKQLSELFKNSSEDLFSLCLLITESSDNLSTHMFSQTFLKCNNTSYDQIPLHIVNLSDPNNTYKSSEPCSETFTKIMTSLKLDPQRTQGLTVITKIQNALWKHIDTVIEELSEAEKRMFDLESEVRKLQEVARSQICLGLDDETCANSSDMLVNGGEEAIPISPPVQITTPPRKSSVRGRGRGGGNTPKSKKRSSHSPTKPSPEIETEIRASPRKTV